MAIYRTDLGGVDLNLIRALDALLTELSVTQAAVRLGIGQSGMSAALARLRRHYGDPLLVRSGRSLRATPLAESLAPRARAAVEALTTVFIAPEEFDPRVHARSFRIMVSDYVTLVLLKPLVEELSAQTPLQRAIVVPVQAGFAEMLAAGDIDLLVIPAELPGAPTAMAHRHLFRDRFVLIADADNNDVAEGISPAAFGQLPYVTYNGGFMDSFADVQLRALGFLPRVEMSTEGFLIAPFLVSRSRFVSIVHERLARKVAGLAHLKVLDPPVELRPVSETAFWHPRHTDDAAHAWWRGRIAEFADRL